MSSGLSAINVFLHDTVLVDTNCGENIQSSLVTWVNTVENEADDNLLPSWATLVPEFRFFQVDDFTNVLHDTMQSSGSENFVFVVVCNCNKKLGVTVVHGWS